MQRFWKYAVVTLMMLAVVQMAGCRAPTPHVSGEIISVAPGTLGAAAFSLELEQVFGGDETNPDALLGWVTSIAVGEDGTVYAVDSRANRVVAFDNRGAVVWRIDDVGEGPGQIRYPGELVIAGEQLWMVNQAGQRLDQTNDVAATVDVEFAGAVESVGRTDDLAGDHGSPGDQRARSFVTGRHVGDVRVPDHQRHPLLDGA